MQLEITVKQAIGLKHEGKHCLELLLDGHSPQRTNWVDDLYDSEGNAVKPKNFNSCRRTIQLKGSKDNYRDAWLHMTVLHQRAFWEDKRAAEAHVPFSQVSDGFSGWISLEHKEKYGGKLFIVARITQVPERPVQVPSAAPAHAAPGALAADEQDVMEQMAILASIQEAEQHARVEAEKKLKSSSAPTPVPAQAVAGAPGFNAIVNWASDAEPAPPAVSTASWPSWPEMKAASSPPGAAPFTTAPAQAWTEWPDVTQPSQPQLQSLQTAPSLQQRQQLPQQQAQPAPPPQQQEQEQEQEQALPDWLEWHRFLAAYGEDDRLLDGSSSVPVGLRPAQVQGSGAAPAMPTGRRRAVLVGLNYPGTPAELRGSLADVSSASSVLQRLGFSPEWTVMLTDDQTDAALFPTRRNLVAAMRWLTHNVVAGDALFFHFSGHGVQRIDDGADEEDAMDDALCPADHEQAGHVSENLVFDALVRRLPSGVRLTLLMDFCLPCTCPELPFVYDLQRARWAQEENPWHSEGDVICISAQPEAEEDLSLEELQRLRGLERGLVTSSFLQAMGTLAHRRKGPVTYQELLTEVQVQLESAGCRRRPQLTASQAFDTTARTFRFFDAVHNNNPEVGLRSRKIHRSFR